MAVARGFVRNMIHVCECWVWVRGDVYWLWCRSSCIAEPRGVWRTPVASATDLFFIGVCVVFDGYRWSVCFSFCCAALLGRWSARTDRVWIGCVSCALPPAPVRLRYFALPATGSGCLVAAVSGLDTLKFWTSALLIRLSADVGHVKWFRRKIGKEVLGKEFGL